ncbi:Hypothetical predicted protein [Lecanosticta acicola]|uniref:Extracellular membrane protein CFEM domain-containing protein n=1 Tax=Lecanosticta acicola TaxID=111012 RepID=A0AAI8Z4H3_9PEZI|nr:Hypothetical predicted protein [Lecanosticta acicola]
MATGIPELRSFKPAASIGPHTKLCQPVGDIVWILYVPKTVERSEPFADQDEFIVQVTAGSDCSASSLSCFCSNQNVTATFNTCIQSACMPPTTLLEVQRYQADTCNYPVRSKQSLHRGALWATFILATIFVLFRTLSRMPLLAGSGYSYDDHVVYFSYAMAVALAVATEITLKNGSATDEYTLTPDMIVRYMIWTYISEVLYNTLIITTKIAIILLYLRIWSVDKITKAFRIASWSIIGVLVATCIAFDFGLIFQCVPVSSTWEYIYGAMGKCVNLPALTYTFGALSVVYDVIIFFLPIHSLLKLNITWQRKLGVCTVFLVGFIVTICTIVRLQYLVRFSSRQNLTWNYQPVSMWSIIEANLSIVATCMPATAGLFQRCYRYCTGQQLSISTGHVARQRDLSDDGTTTTAVDAGDDGSYGNEKSRIDSGQDSCGKGTESEQSHTDLANVEEALARGEVDGRVRAEREEPFKTTEVGGTNSPQATSEVIDEHLADHPGSTGLVYQPGRNKVEIHHNPPSKPAESELQYRDQEDVVHNVRVIDVPQTRMPGPPIPDRHRDRSDPGRAMATLALQLPTTYMYRTNNLLSKTSSKPVQTHQNQNLFLFSLQAHPTLLNLDLNPVLVPKMRTTMPLPRRSFPALAAHGQLSRRAFTTFPRQSFATKYDQDKDSINPESNEYSKSGGDGAAAQATEKAAFDPKQTSPEEEEQMASREAGGESNNPLNVSPANTAISQPRGQQEGGAQGSEGETGGRSGRARTSGGGSPAKSGGGKSGGGSV